VIVTFYSYKGGVGRSMTLANAADILARSGLRVLMVDFDLEAPGLEHFFPIDHVEARGHEGLLDLLLTFKHSMSTACSTEAERNAFRDLGRFVTTVYPVGDGGGGIDLLSAGSRLTDEQVAHYGEELRRFDWVDFYFSWSGELFFEWLRREFAARYDVVLVDSRTGVTEMGGVCAYQLADVVVLLCAPNLQNVEGTAAMVRHFVSPQVRAVRDDRPVEALVVPARVDQGNSSLQDVFRRRFTERFAAYVPPRLVDHDVSLWDLQIPYEPRYAFDEQVITDPRRDEERRGLAAAYGRLVTALSLLAPEASPLATLRPADPTAADVPRNAVDTRYDPTTRFAAADVFLSFGRRSEATAAEIRDLLRRNRISVATSADPWSPGAAYTRALSDLITAARVGLVLIGPPGDDSPWRQREIDQLTSTGSDRPVVGVLLSGATWDQIPSALHRAAIIDLSSGRGDDLEDVVAGVRAAIGHGRSVTLRTHADRNPYPGLLPFTEEDRDVYLGRDDEVASVLEQLRTHGTSCVVGPPGVGKTSMVFAGLVPELRRGVLPASSRWAVVSMRPGGRPLEALVDALAKAAPDPTGGPSRRPADDVDVLVARLRESFQSVVLVVDQLEEIFTLSGAAERDRFASCLHWIVAAEPAFVVPVLVLRSEFLSDARAVPQLDGLISPGLVVVSPLSQDRLRTAIHVPARRLGVQFEPGLVDRLLRDAGGEPGSVGLLQFVLRQLWDAQKDGYLTHEAYVELGGLASALSRRADAVLMTLSSTDQGAARALMLTLVEIRDADVVRRRVAIGDLDDDARRVVDHFVDAWLLVVSTSESGHAEVQIAHDAIISVWPALGAWIEDARGSIRARTRIGTAAREWADSGRDPTFTMPPERLESLVGDLGDLPLARLEEDFLAASRAEASSVRSRSLLHGTALWSTGAALGTALSTALAAVSAGAPLLADTGWLLASVIVATVLGTLAALASLYASRRSSHRQRRSRPGAS
jgi:MinD-like ATPase involved in chromosome partitioning or flagellar assembly